MDLVLISRMFDQDDDATVYNSTPDYANIFKLLPARLREVQDPLLMAPAWITLMSRAGGTGPPSQRDGVCLAPGTSPSPEMR